MRTPVLLRALQISSTPSPLGLKLVRSFPEDRKQVTGHQRHSKPESSPRGCGWGHAETTLLQDVVHETDPTKSGDNVHVVQESEEPLSGEQSCPDRLQSCMLAQGEQEGHESVSLFPSSSLVDVMK